MKPRTLLALGAVSLGLFGYTLCQLAGGGAPARERPPAVADEPAKKPAEAARPLPDSERDAGRDALAIALRSRLERALEGPPELPPLPAPDNRLEAETAFEVVMSSIEDLADRGKRVPRGRRKQLYRAANDAFAALSDHLDARDPRDLAALDEAHSRLKLMLQEIDAGPPGS